MPMRAEIDETPMNIRIRVNEFGIAEALDKPRGVSVTIVNQLHPRLSLDYPSDEELSGGAWPAGYEARFLEEFRQHARPTGRGRVSAETAHLRRPASVLMKQAARTELAGGA